MIGAGALRHLVALEQRLEDETTQDATGATVPTWSEFARVYAEIRAASGREAAVAQQMNAEVSTIVKIRHRTDVTPSCRVVYGARVFDVQAILDEDGRSRYLKLMCREVEA